MPKEEEGRAGPEPDSDLTASYARGTKGSLGVRIFFKGVIYLLINQMVFFGAPVSFSTLSKIVPEPIREAIEEITPEPVKEIVKNTVESIEETFEMGEAEAFSVPEFVSVVDP